MSSILVGITIVIVFSCTTALDARAQPLRFASIERRSNVVALIADARSGALLGGVRTSEARTASYHPASLFKLAIALAALDGHGRVDFDRACHGLDTIGGHPYRCWLAAGHGELGLADAIARSCNVYFRRMARGVSLTAIGSSARALGLLPSDEAIAIDDSTLLGEAAAVSPSMMMRTALALASRGRLSRPMLSLSGARYEPVYRGLIECVRVGTARAAWSRRITIAGKTGTTLTRQSSAGRAGWFIGFAPSRNPKYAIVVLHRDGLGSDAAAIAREMIESIL